MILFGLRQLEERPQPGCIVGPDAIAPGSLDELRDIGHADRLGARNVNVRGMLTRVVPRDVPAPVMRAKLRVIDPHHDVLLDIVKLVVIVGLIVVGIVLRLRPMPARVAGAGPMILGVVLFVYWGKRATNRAVLRERALVATLGKRPFPIHGYSVWLAADVPVFEVAYAEPVDPKLAGEPGVTKVDDRTVRVELPPRTIAKDLKGGDPKELARFLDRWGTNVASVDMGGTAAGR